MSAIYIHFSSFKKVYRTAGATLLFLNASTAYAQLPTLGDLLNSIIVLNGQVADHANSLVALDLDVGVLNSQTTNNTTAITQLGYDLNAVTAQLAANGNVITAVDGRLSSIETMLPPVVARTTALETAVANQVSATAGAAAAITANANAIAATTARVDNQDALIAANVNVGLQNTASINVNANAIVDIDARVDAHDVVLAQHTVNIANATNIAINAQNSTTDLRNEIIAGQIGLVQQQTSTSTITVGAQTGGTVVSVAGTAGSRRITGVADGIGPSDAATVGQVAQSQAQAVTIANDYTDRSIANIVQRYDDHTNSLIAANNSIIRRDINAAAASTAAISSLPHSIMPGEGMGAVGIGGRGDSVAFAIGVSKAFRVEHTPVVRAGAAVDARTGTLSYNAAVGVHF